MVETTQLRRCFTTCPTHPADLPATKRNITSFQRKVTVRNRCSYCKAVHVGVSSMLHNTSLNNIAGSVSVTQNLRWYSGHVRPSRYQLNNKLCSLSIRKRVSKFTRICATNSCRIECYTGVICSSRYCEMNSLLSHQRRISISKALISNF